MIWLPMVWTGLNDDIGSWKISAISSPRIARIAAPFGSSLARSTVAPPPSRAAAEADLALDDSPGRSTMPQDRRAR